MSKDIFLATCSKRCTPLPPYMRCLSLETCFFNHNSGETRHGKRLRECEGGVREKKTKSLPKACLAREKTSSLTPLKWFLYIGCLKERMLFFLDIHQFIQISLQVVFFLSISLFSKLLSFHFYFRIQNTPSLTPNSLLL